MLTRESPCDSNDSFFFSSSFLGFYVDSSKIPRCSINIFYVRFSLYLFIVFLAIMVWWCKIDVWWTMKWFLKSWTHEAMYNERNIKKTMEMWYKRGTLPIIDCNSYPHCFPSLFFIPLKFFVTWLFVCFVILILSDWVQLGLGLMNFLVGLMWGFLWFQK